MKKKIIIIGANDFQNQLILKAKDMGYETHVFAWECGDIGEKTADYFYPISIVEKEQILEICKGIKPDGIISIASDLASITVNYVAEELGLVGNGKISSMLSTNKHLMRNAFKEMGLPSPKSIKVSSISEVDLSFHDFPLIVKPTDRSGSRGIFKIENESQLAKAIECATEESFEKKVLIEEFAEGNEFSIEYVSFKGNHFFLAATRKYTTGSPNFIEMGHSQPSGLSQDTILQIQTLIPKALNALGIKNGASHSEIKIDDNGNIRIIEIGGRMGGDCIGSDLVYLSTGYDFLEMVVDIALGNELKLEKKHELAYSAVRFIFTKEDLQNLEWVKNNHSDAISRISEILPIDGHLIEDSSTRYGYYLLSTKNESKMNEILRKING